KHVLPSRARVCTIYSWLRRRRTFARRNQITSPQWCHRWQTKEQTTSTTATVEIAYGKAYIDKYITHEWERFETHGLSYHRSRVELSLNRFQLTLTATLAGASKCRRFLNGIRYLNQ